MIAQSRILSERIAGLEAEIGKLPPGSINITESGGYVRWYLAEEGNKTYIPKRKRSFAQNMARKKYLEYLKKDMQHDKNCIDSYLIKSSSYQRKIPKLFDEPGFKELLTKEISGQKQEIEEWCKSEFETNKYNLEGLIFGTASGHVVRSKSESIIASELFMNNVPFRYECILNLGDKICFPDFTIRHPRTGEYFYWEHFGMMDKPEYAKKASDKLGLYIAHGIFPTINLITTYETLDKPITQLKISEIVGDYFG